MVEFSLFGQRFEALNGGPHFPLNVAIALPTGCESAEDVDRHWDALTADGGAEGRCGWLKSGLSVSWQVIPDGLGALMSGPVPVRAAQAMMAMNKLDLAAMRAAADGVS